MSFTAEFRSFPLFYLLSAAFLWAVAVVFYRKSLSHVNPLLTNVFTRSLGTLFVGLTILSMDSSFLFPAQISYWAPIIYSSIGAFCVASTIWYYLLQREEAVVLSTSSLAVPIMAFIFGWLLLDETLNMISILGSVLIMLGLYLVNRHMP